MIIDFAHAKVVDHSGITAIDSLAGKYQTQGKRLHLVHLSEDCRLLLDKAAGLVEVNVLEDPTYFVSDDAIA